MVLLAPALGLAFDFFLFRHIPNTNTTAKIVTGISLLVGIPALLPVIFGNQNLYNPASILFNPDIVYFRVAGTPVNGIFLASVVVTAAVLVAMVVLMRFTPLGLQMRGAVESRRLVQLDGINAGGVVSVAWAVSSLLAGLAGRAAGTPVRPAAGGQLRHPDGGGHRRRLPGACCVRCPSPLAWPS